MKFPSNGRKKRLCAFVADGKVVEKKCNHPKRNSGKRFCRKISLMSLSKVKNVNVISIIFRIDNNKLFLLLHFLFIGGMFACRISNAYKTARSYETAKEILNPKNTFANTNPLRSPFCPTCHRMKIIILHIFPQANRVNEKRE